MHCNAMNEKQKPKELPCPYIINETWGSINP